MAQTLATLRDAVEINLSDQTNLIFSTTVLDEAIRAALRELSRTYGSALLLNGLDGATVTTTDDIDDHVLIIGSVAHALTFRAVGRFEEAIPNTVLPEKLAAFASKCMHEFQSLLTQVQIRRFQESSDTPYSAWTWEEGTGF